MSDLGKKLWTLVDLQIPLVTTDVETYLAKEGVLTQEDQSKFKEAVKMIKQAYLLQLKSPDQAIAMLRKALETLKTIQPKKPMPPEMKIRFDSLLKTLSEATSNT